MLARHWLVVSLLACAPAWAADKAPFDRIVFFGTSLSDPGNAFALRGESSTPPDWSVDPFLVPDRPYARGGHHFSNGATWAEQFARRLGLGGSARPAFGDAGGSNYAVGGARAYDDGMNVNLPDQVRRFLQDAGGEASPDSLYVVEMGGNDLRDALLAAAGGGDPAAILSAALFSISDSLMQLYVAGAREFLVWSAPDIGRTPAVGALGAAVPAGQLTVAFNAGLDGLLAQLAPALPGVRFTRLDAYAKLNTVMANPRLFGLRNVTAACITPSAPPFACKKADEYLFWDGIHPTKATHGIIAHEAAHIVQQ
ncbi:MAG TPA: SGNH/GDSL hydrolase family protein [Burkholderiales bacterium]|nr:SGNH/GDSL hydrolase family protein [Burkholderiales bacterium]